MASETPELSQEDLLYELSILRFANHAWRTDIARWNQFKSKLRELQTVTETHFEDGKFKALNEAEGEARRLMDFFNAGLNDIFAQDAALDEEDEFL